jgi:hypothetical protein
MPFSTFSIDDVAVAQKATPSTTGARGKGTNEKASAGCQGVGGGTVAQRALRSIWSRADRTPGVNFWTPIRPSDFPRGADD